MTTQQKPNRPNYDDVLHKRAGQLHDAIEGANHAQAAMELIYQALKETALESWKNGIEAGRRKAQGSPNRPPATDRDGLAKK
jgi:hypothetical protein